MGCSRVYKFNEHIHTHTHTHIIERYYREIEAL